MQCGSSGVTSKKVEDYEEKLREIRFSNSESGVFSRYGQKIFMANLTNLDFHPLICRMPSGNFDFQKIVTQRFCPAVATGLKRDHFQPLSNKTLAEGAVLVCRQFTQDSIPF